MRIVIYNFVPPGDPMKRQGGGVAIYQKNLVAELTRQGHEVISLCSGVEYDVFNRRPYLRASADGSIVTLRNGPIFEERVLQQAAASHRGRGRAACVVLAQ